MNKKFLLTITILITLFSYPFKIFSYELSDEQVDHISQFVLEPLNDGFQINDLITIISRISDCVEKQYHLARDEKCKMTTQILCHIIDVTDTPGLPDYIFDGIFKSLVPHFVAMMYPEKTERKEPSSSPDMLVADNAIEVFFAQLHDGFTLDDIPRCITFSAQFFSNYKNLKLQEKKSAAKQLFFKIIDETDTPYLPDFIFDNVFKQIGAQMIDYLMDHQIL